MAVTIRRTSRCSPNRECRAPAGLSLAYVSHGYGDVRFRLRPSRHRRFARGRMPVDGQAEPVVHGRRGHFVAGAVRWSAHRALSKHQRQRDIESVGSSASTSESASSRCGPRMTTTDRLYYRDAYRTSFAAEIVDRSSDGNARLPEGNRVLSDLRRPTARSRSTRRHASMSST